MSNQNYYPNVISSWNGKDFLKITPNHQKINRKAQRATTCFSETISIWLKWHSTLLNYSKHSLSHHNSSKYQWTPSIDWLHLAGTCSNGKSKIPGVSHVEAHRSSTWKSLRLVVKLGWLHLWNCYWWENWSWFLFWHLQGYNKFFQKYLQSGGGGISDFPSADGKGLLQMSQSECLTSVKRDFRSNFAQRNFLTGKTKNCFTFLHRCCFPISCTIQAMRVESPRWAEPPVVLQNQKFLHDRFLNFTLTSYYHSSCNGKKFVVKPSDPFRKRMAQLA